MNRWVRLLVVVGCAMGLIYLGIAFYEEIKETGEREYGNSTKPTSYSSSSNPNKEKKPLMDELNNPATCYARGFGSLIC